MVFSSKEFLFYFLPTILLLYYSTPNRYKNLILLIASYIFYGWWDYRFIPLMILVTYLNYVCGKLIQKHPRLGLTLSIMLSLSVLGFFKYFVFIQANLNYFIEFPILNIILPIVISFYIFQSLSYTIDIYRNDAPPARSLVDFACYIALFPQLIAGPIVRYRTISEQLRERKHNNVSSGVALFILGLAKKVIIADGVAVIADAAFAAESPGFREVWFGACAYAFQIYFDFSGYSDMAIGLGRMFGFEFPKNFDAPYMATSITDFWRRWHISLSSFLRDYLYIPLGGNRNGEVRTYINLIIVMLLGGLWHGANWTFIVWGAYHGIILASERMIGKNSIYKKTPRIIQIIITFILVVISLVVFRSENIESALAYIKTMIIYQPSSGVLELELLNLYNILLLLSCCVLCWQNVQAFDWVNKITAFRTIILIILLNISIGVILSHEFSPFLYFQF